MDWINNYIGLPYQLNGRELTGLDCYGLLCRVFKDRRGVDLPDWTAADGSAKAAIKVLQQNIDAQEKAGFAHLIFVPVDWSIITVHRATRAHHIGVFLCGGVLHCDHANGSEWTPYARFARQYPWKLKVWKWLV